MHVAPDPVIKPRPTVLGSLPSGRAGAIETLKIMRALARQYAKSPVILSLASSLTANVREKAWAKEVTSLFEFVRDQIRYVRDPVGVEMVHTPVATLDRRQGDCDDKATLLASLLHAVGHPARFVAIGLFGGPLSHVYLETRVGPRWIPCETTEPWPVGAAMHRGVTSKYVLEI